MICKECGKDYHYCPSCGEEDYLEENFCSPNCKRVTDPEYKSFDEKVYEMNPVKTRPAKIARKK